jgi:hypothetical protein
VIYERTVCFCLVVYCFLNIAKCAEEKRISQIFLLLTWHSNSNIVASIQSRDLVNIPNMSKDVMVS